MAKTIKKIIILKIMDWIVYFLKSQKKENWVYVGSTNNLFRRLNEHKSGKVPATKGFRPLNLIRKEEFETEKEARGREYYLKGWKGRIEKKKILQKIL